MKVRDMIESDYESVVELEQKSGAGKGPVTRLSAHDIRFFLREVWLLRMMMNRLLDMLLYKG